MKKTSEFRSWVASVWRENCAENRDWREPELSLTMYWNRYKYWLKREFRHQKRLDQ